MHSFADIALIGMGSRGNNVIIICTAWVWESEAEAFSKGRVMVNSSTVVMQASEACAALSSSDWLEWQVCCTPQLHLMYPPGDYLHQWSTAH